MHVTSNPAIWYAARASGVAAYVVLSLVVCLGLTLGGKAQSRRWPRFSVEDDPPLRRPARRLAHRRSRPGHRGRLVPPVLARAATRPVHVDATGRSGRGSGSPPPRSCVALAITNHYRKRLPYRFWRKAHYLNFAVWGARVAARADVGHRPRRRVAARSSTESRSRVVVMLLVWRFGGLVPARRADSGCRRSDGRRAAAPDHRPARATRRRPGMLRTWTRASPGSVIRNGTKCSRSSPSSGRRSRPQKLLVRADLLVAPRHARAHLAPARVPAERRRLPRQRDERRRRELHRHAAGSPNGEQRDDRGELGAERGRNRRHRPHQPE